MLSKYPFLHALLQDISHKALRGPAVIHVKFDVPHELMQFAWVAFVIWALFTAVRIMATEMYRSASLARRR